MGKHKGTRKNILKILLTGMLPRISGFVSSFTKSRLVVVARMELIKII